MGKTLPRLVVFSDPKKGQAVEVVRHFKDFAKNKAQIIATCNIDDCTADVLKEADFAVVFGGDGSIISAARHLSRSNVPVIGVNLGKLGFLAEFSYDELKKCFDSIISGKASIEKRMMLSCKVCSGNKVKLTSSALNDVFIAAGPPFRMVELKVLVDGQPLAGCVSDGLVISTPTGSTAYNLSAGGPILSGRLEAMVVAPLCPHSLNFRPIVISAGSRIEVIGLRVNKGTTVSVDGQISMKLSVNDVVKVERAKGHFLIVNNPFRTEWDTLATKLNWAEKPKYRKP